MTFLQSLLLAFVGGGVIGFVGSAVGTPLFLTLVLCGVWGIAVTVLAD